MEDARNFVKDNFMLLVFGVMLLCIASLGSLVNTKMDYSSTESMYTENVNIDQF